MSTMVSQITSPTTVCSSVYSGADQRKRQSSVSLAFVRRIHRWPVNSPHKGPVTQDMLPFDDVIMRVHPPHSRHHCQHQQRLALPIKLLKPKQNGRNFADNICKCILFEIGLIWLKFVPKGTINNNAALFKCGLVPNKHQAIIWTNVGLIYWHIYASFGLNNSINNTAMESLFKL